MSKMGDIGGKHGGLLVVDDHSGVTTAARVLLIEDDPRAAMMIGEMLRATWTEGLVLAHAERLTDAMEELRHHGATCVVLDLPRTESDQLGPLHYVRAAAPDVPIVVLSDRTDEGTGLRAIKIGRAHV